jgi:hypothetical protein
MSDTRTEQTVHIDGAAPLGQAVAAAFAELGHDVRTAVFVFPAGCRPEASLVGLLASAASRCAALEAIVLVHPSAAMGFVASSLGLRLPALEVRRVRTTSELAATQSYGLAVPPRTVVVHMGVDEDADAFVRRAFQTLRERAARRGVIVFAHEAVLDGIVTEEIGRELAESASVHRLALVHPTAALDHSAAAIAIRQPRVHVVTARDAEAATEALDAG